MCYTWSDIVVGALGQFQMTGALLGVRWRSSCNLCVLGISIFAVGSQSGLWSGARVGECHVVLQEMVNMCGCHRILWLFVHAADEGHFVIRSLCFVKRGTVFHSRRLLMRCQCFGDDMLLNALDGSRCHSGPVVERGKVAEVCDVGVLTFSETHARVCACRESLVLHSCSRAPTSYSLSQVPSSLGGLRGCRHIGVLTTCASESSLVPQFGVFDASECCAVSLELTLAQSSVFCALSHDGLCSESHTVRDVLMLCFAESHSSGCLHQFVRWLCVFPWGWRERLSTHQVQRLPLRRPRLHWRKRDCTLALFSTTSASTSATSLCTSEEEGLHTLPPHNDGVYFGGRETGSRPHTDECFMCHRHVF